MHQRINYETIHGLYILAIGIATGIAANSLGKISDGFTKLTPTIACLILMSVTMFSLAKAMTVIPVGFAYSTYSGLTVSGCFSVCYDKI